MEDLGKKIYDARQSKGLSIDEISEKTKIRPHVIKSFEKNDFSIMPPVYVKSFLKTLFKELGLSTSLLPEHYSEKKEQVDSDFKIKDKKEESAHKAETIKSPEKTKDTKETKKESNPLKEEFRKKERKPKKKITFDTEVESKSDYVELFKSKKAQKTYTPNLINYIVYSIVGIAVLAAIYFTFFYGMFNGESPSKDEQSALSDDSAVVISPENKDLFSNFIPAKPDSIILVARAIDTAWLSIQIDGKTSEQMLMKPGMEKRWSAKEFFNITQGNAGAVEYIRNDKLLEPFGRKGTVVRNIKITMDEVLNASTEVQDSLRRINSTNNPKPKKRIIRRIEPSKIENGRNN